VSSGRGISRIAWAILGAGAAARLAIVLALDPHLWVAGSDTPFYVDQGWRLARGISPLFSSVAPAFTWLIAAAWAWFPKSAPPASPEAIPVALLTVVRIVQVALSLGMVASAVVLARRWSDSGRGALVTCAGLALGPAFVLEPFRVLTESLFLCLLYLGLLLFSTARREGSGKLIAAGCVLGLAALVRPVVMGLPVALAAGYWLTADRPERRRRALAFLLVFAAMLAPWSLSLHHHTGSWLPSGLAANVWIGAVGDGRWHGRDATDVQRDHFVAGPDDYLGETLNTIREAPIRWLLLRARNLGAALAQPHFASDVPGPSTKQAVARWWRRDRTPEALLSLLSAPPVVLKLALYAAHWCALLGGLAGLLRWRRRWRELLPLWAVILYFPSVHVVLTALPRYLLPIEPGLWIAVALLFRSPTVATSPASARSPEGSA
jgi:4-amino-4-deoxy-L-arabinose transferase-like glycosyltransferase